MDKNAFNKLFINQEAEMIDLIYTVSNGESKINSYLKKIKFVDDEHFSTTGYGYNIQYKEIQKWRLDSLSSNHYSYRIFLLKDEPIDNYIAEINEKILRSLTREIDRLKKTMEVISS